jgi:hypothetical protein
LFLCFVTAPAIEIQNEKFALADVTHGGVAEPREGVLDRLALGIEHRTFWHNPDVCLHGLSITSPRTASRSPLFARREEGVFETHVHDTGQFFFP